MSVISTNIGLNFMLARQAALQMKQKGQGRNRLYQLKHGLPRNSRPCGLQYFKSGILGMNRALALDLGKYGIRVNAVLPGMIKNTALAKQL